MLLAEVLCWGAVQWHSSYVLKPVRLWTLWTLRMDVVYGNGDACDAGDAEEMQLMQVMQEKHVMKVMQAMQMMQVMRRCS